MAVDPRFKKGLELFNQKEFFECHEVIEELWLETPKKDPYRDFYKGVIQSAAALYQFKRGILSGAYGLFKTAVRNLEKYPSSVLGLDVQKLITQMKTCFKDFEDWDGKKKLSIREKDIPVLSYDG